MSIYLRIKWSWLNKSYSLSLFYLEQQCPHVLPGVVGHDALKAAVDTRHVDAELLVAQLYTVVKQTMLSVSNL